MWEHNECANAELPVPDKTHFSQSLAIILVGERERVYHIGPEQNVVLPLLLPRLWIISILPRVTTKTWNHSGTGGLCHLTGFGEGVKNSRPSFTWLRFTFLVPSRQKEIRTGLPDGRGGINQAVEDNNGCTR